MNKLSGFILFFIILFIAIAFLIAGFNLTIDRLTPNEPEPLLPGFPYLEIVDPDEPEILTILLIYGIGLFFAVLSAFILYQSLNIMTAAENTFAEFVEKSIEGRYSAVDHFYNDDKLDIDSFNDALDINIEVTIDTLEEGYEDAFILATFTFPDGERSEFQDSFYLRKDGLAWYIDDEKLEKGLANYLARQISSEKNEGIY